MSQGPKYLSLSIHSVVMGGVKKSTKLAPRMGSAARPPRRPSSPDFDDQRLCVYLEALLSILKELNGPVPTRVSM